MYNGAPFTVEKILPQAGIELGPLDQSATELPGLLNTVELQWLEHLWNHENMFETGVFRANEC